MADICSVGYDIGVAPNLSDVISKTQNQGFHFLFIPIVHPRFKRIFVNGEWTQKHMPLTRPDILLSSQEWRTFFVGKLSSDLDVDSMSKSKREQSEYCLLQELSYASHLNLAAVLLKLKSIECTQIARLIHSKLQSLNQIWVELRMEDISVGFENFCSDSKYHPGPDDPWEHWNKFRILCGYDKKLGVILEIPADLPENNIIERWLGEPVKCLILSTNIFLTNHAGFPVLSSKHRDLIKKFVDVKVQLALRGPERHFDMHLYVQYLNNMFKGFHCDDPLKTYGQGYEDYLQCPLQPLFDNLDCGTYEVFEKDPVKYRQYQLAIIAALEDKIPLSEIENKTVTVLVVGAGRGPLVRAALNAAEISNRKVQIYAVEKNPNALVTLLAQEHEVWPKNVKVFGGDMRRVELPELADIMVSELLGSFGDNELSPECLDGAQRLLKEDGISIPTKYTSYVCPVQSSKLYAEARDTRDKDKPVGYGLETPYVVYIASKYVISPNQPLFTFEHPNKEPFIDNRRHKKLRFGPITQNCVLHGFSGYFDAALYKNIMLSIAPETHSEGMFSWFPIYFPIKNPIQLKSGDMITLDFWRCCTARNVWYEWAVSEPVIDSIHNLNGHFSNIVL